MAINTSGYFQLNFPWVTDSVNEQPSPPNIRSFSEWVSVLLIPDPQMLVDIMEQYPLWFTEVAAGAMVTSFWDYQGTAPRTGVVTAADGDYPASFIDNDSGVPGAKVGDALDYLLAALSSNLYWLQPVQFAQTSPPAWSDGDRCLITGTGTGIFAGHDYEIATATGGGTSATFETMLEGAHVALDGDLDKIYRFDGSVIQTIDFGEPNAIRWDVSDQFDLVAEKVTPVNADRILIEDSEDAYAKKYAQIGNLPGGGGIAISNDIVADSGSTTKAPSVAVVEAELLALEALITALQGQVNGLPGAFQSSRKIYDLRADFGLNPIDGSKTLAQLGISSGNLNYARAKLAWDNIFVPRSRLYGGTIEPSDFTSLNWCVACHMEAVFRGHGLGFTRDIPIASMNHVRWPQGRYALNFPGVLSGGGASGAGPTASANKGIETGGTMINIDHNNWLGFGSAESNGLRDKTPFITHSYGQGFSTLGYLEMIPFFGFTIECNGGNWQDPGEFFHGVGFSNGGELSLLDRIYARKANNGGVFIGGAGPAVVGDISVFDNCEAGLLLDSESSLGNFYARQVSGDDNGYAHVFIKNGMLVTIGTIKHETGLSASRVRAAKSNPSIFAQGWVNATVHSISHATGTEADVPVLIYVKHSAGTKSGLSVGHMMGWSFSRVLVDLTERQVGSGPGTNFSGTAPAVTASRPIVGGSFRVYDSSRHQTVIADANGANTTNTITLETATGVTLKRGTIEILGEGDADYAAYVGGGGLQTREQWNNSRSRIVVARLKCHDGGPVSEWFDPQYTPISGRAQGASGTFNTSTGVGSVTFSTNALPTGATVRFYYDDDIIGLDDGAGNMGGIYGIGGTVNYTTGAWTVTASTPLRSSARIKFSSPRMFGSQFGGTEFAVFKDTRWENDNAYNQVVSHEVPFQETPAPFYGSTDRIGFVDDGGARDLNAGTPVWDISGAGVVTPGGMIEMFYNQQTLADRVESHTITGIRRIDIIGARFINVGGSGKWLADTIEIRADGTVWCDGVQATVEINNGGTVTTGPIFNGSWRNKWSIIPAAPFDVTEFFGKTGSTSVQFQSEVFQNDTNIEIYG